MHTIQQAHALWQVVFVTVISGEAQARVIHNFDNEPDAAAYCSYLNGGERALAEAAARRAEALKRRPTTPKRTITDIVETLLRDLKASGLIAHKPRCIEEQSDVIGLVTDELVELLQMKGQPPA